MPQKKQLVLGSESPFRRKVLAGMGLDFHIVPPNIDERAIRDANPTRLTQLLAAAKGETVAGKLRARGVRNVVILTSDQVIVWGGQVREKPADEAQAREFLKSYASGEPIEHVTSVCAVELVDGEIVRQVLTTDLAYVQLLPLPDVAIGACIKRGDVMKSCGALVIDDPDIVPHVKAVWNVHGTSDARSSVMGLPIACVRELLRDCGAT